MGAAAMASDARSSERIDVLHRTRATTTDGRPLVVTIVNVSAGGFMARCETPFERGDRVRVELPVLGYVGAGVRWALGGRIGCELDAAPAAATYVALLAALRRD